MEPHKTNGTPLQSHASGAVFEEYVGRSASNAIIAVRAPSTSLPKPSQHIMSAGIVTAGVMGVMGNKGGVGIRLRLCSSSLCFVTAHLAAHRDNVRARNDNYLKVRIT